MILGDPLETIILTNHPLNIIWYFDDFELSAAPICTFAKLFDDANQLRIVPLKIPLTSRQTTCTIFVQLDRLFRYTKSSVTDTDHEFGH